MHLRTAVVGYGYWGSKHVRVLNGLPEVSVTVVDGTEERRIEAQRAFPGIAVAARLEDVLDDVDAVVVATPPSSHFSLAKVALEAGRHVLVEKPLATSVEDCEELVALAEAKDLRLMVGHTFEYNSGVWKLREIIESGDLGEVLYIDTARLNLGLYQPDVNVIWDLAPHDISIVNFLLRSSPTSVVATAEAHRGGRYEDVAHLQLQYEDPHVTAYIRVSWLDPCKVRRVTVVGDQKMVVNNDMASERIRVYDMGVDPSGPVSQMHEMPLEYRYGDIVSPQVPFNEPLGVEDQHFARCVRMSEQPWSDGRVGLEVVRVLDAANRSVAEERTIHLAASGSSV